MKKTLLIVCATLAALTYSCKDEPIHTTEPRDYCDSLGITYDGHIKAVMDANCAIPTCHTQAAKSGGFALSTYFEVRDAAKKDNFLGAIKREQGFKGMPIGAPKLSDEIVEQLECWQENAFPQN